MAGIGFQLKKLFNKKGVMANVRAYLYSTLVTVGPTLIYITIITSLNIVLKKLGVPLKDIEVLQATIMYSFIFSLILCSGYCMILSRYLADKLYQKKHEDILPSLLGSLAIIVTIGGIIGLIFYLFSPIQMIYKVFSYILFIQLIIQSIITSYISALKNYKRILWSFVWGFAIALISAIVLSKLTSINLILISIIAFNIGILILNIILVYEVQNYFNSRSKKYFEFLTYIKRYILIFLTNTFWMLGLYVHNFIYWTVSSINHIVAGTYVYSPGYDIPAFYAFITIIPTLVIFVVKLETEFFVKYSVYFDFINNKASYKDIELAKVNMKSVLYKEIIYAMEVQLFFTIGFIILGMKMLPILGFSNSMINLFSMLCLGYYCAIIMFCIMTILLYFEDKEGAVLTTLIFFIANLVFTLITVLLGEFYYGTGLFLSGLLSLAFAFFRLRYFIDNIEYYVFCKHTSWSK